MLKDRFERSGIYPLDSELWRWVKSYASDNYYYSLSHLIFEALEEFRNVAVDPKSSG